MKSTEKYNDIVSSGQITHLRDLADVQMGYQTRARVNEDLDGDFTIIRSQDVDECGHVNLNQAMRFHPLPGIDPKSYLISQGDILVQARGQNHQACLIEQHLSNTVASNTFYIIKKIETSRVLPSYFMWWLNQPQVQGFFERESGISTIPFISKDVLLRAPVWLPPMITQEKISRLVNLWRREQALIKDMVNKKDNLVQAVAARAVEKLMEEK